MFTARWDRTIHTDLEASTVQKTEHGMKPILPSNLPIRGMEFIENKYFNLGLFFN